MIRVASEAEPIELPSLKFIKQHEAEVLVVDAKNQPLANHVIRRFGKGSFGHTNARGVTDEKGVATVRYSRSTEPKDFSGEWIIAENDQAERTKDPRDLPRLKMKQSSPPILQTVR